MFSCLSKSDHLENKLAGHIFRDEYRLDNTISSEHIPPSVSIFNEILQWHIHRSNKLKLYTASYCAESYSKITSATIQFAG